MSEMGREEMMKAERHSLIAQRRRTAELSFKNKYRMCKCVYVLLFLVVGTCVSVTDLYARTYTKNTYM